MLSTVRARLTYANVLSTLCLFMLLGGGAYAASTLPNNSVGTEQIQRDGVTKPDIAEDAVGPKEIREGAVKSSEVRDGSLKCMDFNNTDICAPGPVGPRGPAGPEGPPGADTAEGLTTTIARSHVEVIEMTCNPNDMGAQDCSGAETVTASCEPGEVATGGSATAPGPQVRTSTTVSRDRPDPVSGVPTGWTAEARSSGFYFNDETPVTQEVTVHVVCAS